jgi:hypothetical protein
LILGVLCAFAFVKILNNRKICIAYAIIPIVIWCGIGTIGTIWAAWAAI